MVRRATSWVPLAASLVVVPMAGCSTASYGTGESPEAAIFREMTGGLLSPKKKAPIYEARAPLVLPPSGEASRLPPPAPAAEVADAQWPRDPDQTEPDVKVFAENSRDDISQEDYRRLKPLAGLAPKRQAADRRLDYGKDASFQPAYEMVGTRKQRETFKAALNDANGIHAERRFLTDPPETVKAPAPTAPQEFDKIDKKKKGNILTRWFKSS